MALRGSAFGIGCLLLASPLSFAHHATPTQQLLLDESDLMPRWHSTVLEWEGTKRISGHLTILDPHAALVVGGEEEMWGSAVVLEYQQPNGSWHWFAAISGNAAGVGNSDTRFTIQGPIYQEAELGGHFNLEDGNNTFAWILTGSGGKYRVTTWAAGEVDDGVFAAPLWGEEGVRLLGHTEGDDVTWVRADDHAFVAAGGSVKNHGVWSRALASVNHTFEHAAFITDPVSLQFQTCLCRYTGPVPEWGGDIGISGGSVFNGPTGTYAIDVFASQNNREFGPDPFNPTQMAPRSYNDALAWTFADVEAPDV